MTVRGALLLMSAALLQVTVLGRLDAGLPAPNLVLALCAARAWTRGGRAGMVWAVAGGFLLDLGGSVGPLGVHALAMLAAAFVAGILAGAFEDRSPLLAALAGAAAGVVYGGVLLAAADSLRLAEVTMHQALPLLAGGAVIAAVTTTAAAAGLARWEGRREVAPQW